MFGDQCNVVGPVLARVAMFVLSVLQEPSQGARFKITCRNGAAKVGFPREK